MFWHLSAPGGLVQPIPNFWPPLAMGGGCCSGLFSESSQFFFGVFFLDAPRKKRFVRMFENSR